MAPYNHPLSYVLPIRWASDEGRQGLTAYLEWLAERCGQVIVVDGSPPSVFAGNAAAWSSFATHIAPDADLRTIRMGKVAGVLTGVRRAREEAIVLADDDVRYDDEGLSRMVDLLADCDLVSPQNFFDPMPWHAQWDTARTLVNRALGNDPAGTIGVRKSSMEALDGYDGEVLFDNLELIRTVEAAGGWAVAAPDLYVARVPPSTSRFWEQRTRQAYEEFATPARMAGWLAMAPLGAAMLARRRRKELAAGVAAAVAIAEVGRSRHGGSAVFPRGAALLAPVWLAERSVCVWLAVLRRLREGGLRYRGQVISAAANPKRRIRRRFLPLSAEGRSREYHKPRQYHKNT